MKKVVKILVMTLLTALPVLAQTKSNKPLEKNVTNPWEWQDKRSYVQAVEVKNPAGTLYVSGQTAINAVGISSNADMKSQLIQTLENLEKVVKEAGYDCKNIVRLNVYTTSEPELFACFDIFQDWIARHGVRQTTTLLEVKTLFETLKVEVEATVVK